MQHAYAPGKDSYVLVWQLFLLYSSFLVAIPFATEVKFIVELADHVPADYIEESDQN